MPILLTIRPLFTRGRHPTRPWWLVPALVAVVCAAGVPCSANSPAATAAKTPRESPPDYFLTCNPDSFAYIYEHWWLDHYVPCTVTVDGTIWPDCRVRIRGDSSRYRPKKSLKVKTDGEDFPNGNDVLNFNADWLDWSYMRTILATILFERAGVPCFDAAHARLHLNDEFLGLYIAVQNMDEIFLVANGLDPGGNLYKATRDGASLTPEEDVHELWEKKTNENEDWNDLEDLIADLASVPDAAFATWAQEALAFSEVISVVACNALLGNGSTYYHNYYMYHDVNGSGAWSMFPWDLDKTFAAYGPNYTYDRTSSSVLRDNPLPEHIFINRSTFDAFHTRVDELVSTTFNPDFFYSIMDSLQVSIEASVAADTTDNVYSTAAWLQAISLEKSTGIVSRTAAIQEQLDFYPRVCRLDRMHHAFQDSVPLSWHPSYDPNGDPVLYTLRYSQDNQFRPMDTVTFTGMVDTVLTLPDIPFPGTYFWQVFATDRDLDHTMQGSDSYSLFEIDPGTELAPVVAEDLVLTADGSPYFVGRDVVVEAGATLTFEAGTEIRLAAGVSITIHGRLAAVGSAEQPVRLMPYLWGEHWGAICFHDGTGVSTLAHTIIQGASRDGDDPLRQAAISSWRTDIAVDRVSFDDCRQSIYVQGANLFARDCEFLPTNIAETLKVQTGTAVIERCTFWQTASDGDAVDLDAITTGAIRGCVFHGEGQGDDLIDLGSGCVSLVVEDNLIAGAADKGVSVGEASVVTLTGNLIVDCAIGVAIKDASECLVARNTFHGNGTALKIYEKTAGWGGGHGEVVDTILSASQQQAVDVDELSVVEIRYSLCDTEALGGPGNLMTDPLFVAPAAGDFRLQADSPCINAGDPDSPQDPDGTRADMGAFFRDLASRAVIINEINYNAALDFDPQDWVEIHNPSDLAVNLVGFKFKDSNHTFVFPAGTQIGAGGYLVLAENVADFQAHFPGVQDVLGDLDFGFSGSGELLLFTGPDDEIYDLVDYDDSPPWPPEPDGNGPTLELVDPASDNSLAASWSASSGHGTPGAMNSVTISVDVDPRAPKGVTALGGVVPNPFNPRCAVSFTLARTEQVRIAVHDLRGRTVAVLLDEERSAGRYRVTWSGCDARGRALASGVYFVRMRAGGIVEVSKVLLLR